jgi:glycosyltransferase involved in cell wall biosynthesis
MRARPTVLLLAQPTSGGVARHVADLAEGLADRGWAVVVGCPGDGELAGRLGRSRIPVEPIGYVRRLAPLADLAALAATRQAIRRRKPSLVHCHSSKAGFLGRLAAATSGVANTVYTPHCLSFVGDGGARDGVYRLAERMAGRWTSRFIAVADAEAEIIAEAGLGPAESVRRVYNGVATGKPEADPALATRRSSKRLELRAAWGAGPDDVVFTLIGRADRQKACDVFIEAALACLGAQAGREPGVTSGEPGMRFIVVGGDYTAAGALASLADKVEESGATRYIHLLGSRSDADDILLASDAVVVPSRWEAFPYVVLEAGACGLPVIATPVGGIPEVVEDGVTGLLTPVDDPEALARAMSTLAAEPELRAALGSALNERVTEFTLDRMVDETIVLYQELLDEDAAGIAGGK